MENIYYDITEICSYNALYNFIVGERGNGKTYAVKKRGIENFIKKGKHFIYLRRYTTHFSKIKNFFDDIADEFPDNKFEVVGNKKTGIFKIDGVKCGYYIPLSTSNNLKSTNFKDVDEIYFDEFISTKNERYLIKEVDALLDFSETVFRLRNPKIFFIANMIDWYNPYFNAFNINKPKNKKGISCKNDLLIQITNTEEYKEVKQQTPFIQMLKNNNVDYYKYSVYNEDLNNNNNLIKNKITNPFYFYTILIGEEKFAVYINNNNEIIINKKVNENFYHIYTFLTEDLKENILLKNNRDKKIKITKTVLQNGSLFFENEKIKAKVFPILRKYL